MLNSRTFYNNNIPQAQMGSESIAHEAEARMGYQLRGHEGESNNYYCFSKIQLVGQKNVEIKHLSLVKARLFFCQNITNIAGTFCYWWAITYSLV